MILLDPDLDPYPAPAIAARRALPAQPPASRLPSTRSLANFLRIAQAAVRLRGQVTVLLTTDRAIRKLNREFRNIDKATDVLSFPAEFPGVAGDLAIGVPTAFQQASEEGHSLGVEIKVLMLHGLLHLAGYDHEVDEGRMGRRERLLRARLGLPQGLIERSEGDGLQPVRRRIRSVAALAAEGKAGFPAKSPSGAKAPVILENRMYGLKPVPSGLKSAPSRDRSLSRVAGAKAQSHVRAGSARLKSCPDTEQVLASWAALRAGSARLKSCPDTEQVLASGAEARAQVRNGSARLKSCPVTEQVPAAGAEARGDSRGSMRGLKPPPPSVSTVRRDGERSTARRGVKRSTAGLSGGRSTARLGGRVPPISILRPGKPRISIRAPFTRSSRP